MNLYYVWYDQKLEELFCLEKDDMDKQYAKLKKQLINDECDLLLIQAPSMKQAFEAYRKEIKHLYEEDGENNQENNNESNHSKNCSQEDVFENIFEGEQEHLNQYTVLHDNDEYNFSLPSRRRVLH